MDVDQKEVQAQNQDTYDSLVSYFLQSANNIQSILEGDGGSILSGYSDDFQGSLSNLDFSELHRLALMRQDMGPSYAVGSAIETVHLAAAVNREFNMRVTSKAEYYSKGVSELLQEASMYEALRDMHSATLQGDTFGGSLTQ
jgi:RecG-like helicase